MLIIVAGLKRSGTTWAFNVARLALNRAGIGHVSGGDELWHSWDRRTPLLVKTHWWHPGLAADADHIVSSTRDIEHATRSLARLWGREPSGPEVAKVIEHHRRWDRAATFRMTYGDMTFAPADTAKALIGSLGLDADPAEIVAEVDALEPPEGKQDPVTMLLPGHRS